jgi:hypothetical protein
VATPTISRRRVHHLSSGSLFPCPLFYGSSLRPRHLSATMVDAAERLQVLLTQEATFYATSDYLGRMQAAPVAPLLVTPKNVSNAQEELQPGSKKRKSLGSTEHESGHSSDSSTMPGPGKRTHTETSQVQSSEGSSSQINKHWREKICEWAYQGKNFFDRIVPYWHLSCPTKI